MKTGLEVRADALPERTRYQDNGCEEHPSCLSCPLPSCLYDAPAGVRAGRNAPRNQQIVDLRLKGATLDDLARRFGISRRNVFRILRENKRCLSA